MKNTAYLVILFAMLGITATAAFEPQLVTRTLAFLGLSHNQAVAPDLPSELTNIQKQPTSTYGNVQVFDHHLASGDTPGDRQPANHVPTMFDEQSGGMTVAGTMPGASRGDQSATQMGIAMVLSENTVSSGPGFADFGNETNDGYASTAPLTAAPTHVDLMAAQETQNHVPNNTLSNTPANASNTYANGTMPNVDGNSSDNGIGFASFVPTDQPDQNGYNAVDAQAAGYANTHNTIVAADNYIKTYSSTAADAVANQTNHQSQSVPPDGASIVLPDPPQGNGFADYTNDTLKFPGPDASNHATESHVAANQQNLVTPVNGNQQLGGAQIPIGYSDQNGTFNTQVSALQNTQQGDPAFVNNAFQYNNTSQQPLNGTNQLPPGNTLPPNNTGQQSLNAINQQVPSSNWSQPAQVSPQITSATPVVAMQQNSASTPNFVLPPSDQFATPPSNQYVTAPTPSNQYATAPSASNQLPAGQFQTNQQQTPAAAQPETLQNAGAMAGTPQVVPLNPLQSKYEPEVLAEIEPVFGAVLLARVGTESILVCDVLPDVKERANAQWLVLVKENMNGQLPTIEDEREYKSQFIAQVLPILLERKIEMAMLYNDMMVKTQPEAIAPYRQQFVEFFNKNLPNLMKEYQVTNRYELDEKMQKYYGITLDRKKELVVREMLSSGWLSTNVQSSNMMITHDDMLEYYNAHKQEYKHEGKARWEEFAILFSETPNKQEALDRIAALGNRVVKGGETFADVAKQGSQGVTAYKGGEWDWCLQNSLRSKEIDRIIFSLPVGAMSQIILDDAGYHIVRVVERQDTYYTPFDKLYDKIKNNIENERKTKAEEAYMTELRKKYPPIVTLDLQKMIQVASNSAKLQKEVTPIPMLAQNQNQQKSNAQNRTAAAPARLSYRNNGDNRSAAPSTEIATGTTKASEGRNQEPENDRKDTGSKKDQSKKSKSWNPLNLFR